MTDTPETPMETEADTAAEAAPAPHPWAELQAERFRLLRLAPLPTDRATGARPLRFVQFGEVERHTSQQSLLRLFIQLPGQALHRQQNVLEVWADHRSKEVRFGPDTGLKIEPLNRGLGRFLLAQGAAWAKKRWAHYQIEGGSLSMKDVLSEDARMRRDHFLKAQGFDVDYPDARALKATYAAPRVSALHGDWNQDKVQIVELLDGAAMLEQADRSLQEQETAIRTLQERMARFQREDGTLRFTIVCLVAFALFQAGLLIWIATR
ncbi:hypothetical protein DN826_00605 [Stutzerimonas nosocomialis]|uniref:Uncharacterized protein n=1 Tax=Stutzerimonas nosocomialis TaxID=1056496 RepID=A0A5R9QIH6_9GAMM|nr:hypothetical protein [Stutzerimonas nosocomialis]TLX59330.1 hypothetical protein DN826_00605 [Stutzerimonas nosocomialis]TLX64723.1 hypothetical protein DN820_04675 [Stutzerimonas nosocomialis]